MFFNCCRLEERLAQRKAKLAEMKKSQEEELSKNDPDKQESLMKEQVDRLNFLSYQGGGDHIYLVSCSKDLFIPEQHLPRQTKSKLIFYLLTANK